MTVTLNIIADKSNQLSNGFWLVDKEFQWNKSVTSKSGLDKKCITVKILQQNFACLTVTQKKNTYIIGKVRAVMSIEMFLFWKYFDQF